MRPPRVGMFGSMHALLSRITNFYPRNMNDMLRTPGSPLTGQAQAGGSKLGDTRAKRR